MPPSAEGVVVVGGGLAGLNAACGLAFHGVPTLLLEKNAQLGGCAGGLALGGYRFDIGATMVQTPEVLLEAFTAVGRLAEDYLRLVRLDPIYRLRFHDGSSLAFHRSVERTAEEVGSLSPRDRDAFLRYMEVFGRLRWELKRIFVDGALGRRRDFLAPATLKVFRHVNPALTVQGFADRLFADPRVRDAFTFQTLYFGTPPAACPSILAMVPFYEITQGVWHLEGGISTLQSALARVFVELGGVIRTSAEVARIETASGRVRGVTLRGGEHVPARAVVSNADAVYTYQSLLGPAAVPSRHRRRIARSALSCSSLLVLLGLSRRLDGLDHHTFFLPCDAGACYRQVFELGEVPELARYVCRPTATDPTMAPAGCDSLYVLSPAPRRLAGGTWAESGEALAERVITWLEQRGCAGLRDSVAHRVVLCPADYQERFNLPDGMTFGVQSRRSQLGPLRFRVRSPYVAGLFLAGASVHPGAGIPLVLSSGRRAAEGALRFLGVADRFETSLARMTEPPRGGGPDYSPPEEWVV